MRAEESVGSRGRRLARRVGAGAVVATAALFLPLVGATSAGASPAPAGGAAVHAAAAPAAAGAYVALPPTRITDTRMGSNEPNAGKTLSSTGTVTVAMPAAVPATATAVALSVVAVDGTSSGFLAVYPAGSTPSGPSSVLNYVAGPENCNVLDCVVPNLVVTPVGTGGVTVQNGGSTGTVNVVVDLEGYFDPTNATSSGAGHYYPLTPARIADTRCSDSPVGAGATSASCAAEAIPAANAHAALGANSTLDVAVAGQGHVPATGASAAVVQLTVTNPTTPGYLSAFASGTTQPTASNVNFTKGQSTSDRAVVPLGANGAITVYNHTGTSDVVVDVVGYFSSSALSASAGSLFTPVAPFRLADTRNVSSVGIPPNTSGPLLVAGAAGSGIPAVANGSPTAAALNVTEASATSASFLTVTPAPITPPATTSDVNFRPGEIRANADLATLDTSGSISVYNYTGNTQVVVDAFGYFSAAPAVPTSNQTFTVTPATATSVTQGSNVMYTVTGVPAGQAVDIALFSCTQATTTNGITTIAGSSNPGSGTGNAAPAPAGTANVSVVNGATSATGIGTHLVTGVAGTGGTVTFTVTQATPGCVVPVVFAQGAAGPNQDTLFLGSTNSPSGAYGSGGTATFLAPQAAAGAFGATSVTSATPTFFGNGTNTFFYPATATYQLTSASATCATDSFADFQARLSQGDSVSGFYTPTTSTGPDVFCLNDVAAGNLGAQTVTAAPSAAPAGGVKVTFTNTTANEAADAIAGYAVYRAPASTPASTGAPYTCPAALTTTGPAVSPQTPPGSPYAAVAVVPTQPSAAQQSGQPYTYAGGTYTFTDTAAATPAAQTPPNAYCYAVSAVSGNQAGGVQASTATPSSTTSGSPANTPAAATATSPAPVNASAPTGAPGVPKFAALAATGNSAVVAATYTQPVDPATVDANGSDFTASYTVAPSATVTVDNPTAATATSLATNPGVVTLTLATPVPLGAVVTVTAKSGADTNTVCNNAGGTLTMSTNCEAAGDSVVNTMATVANAVAVSSSPTTFAHPGTSTITATVTNGASNVGGDAVTFAATGTGCSVSPTGGTTAANGTVTTTLTGASAGTCMVTATDSTGVTSSPVSVIVS